MGHGEDPLENQIFYIRCIDLCQAAVAIAVQLAIVSGPIARPGIQDSGKPDVLHLGSVLRIGRFQRSRLDPCQLAEIGAEILNLLRGGAHWFHHRMAVVDDRCYVM